MTGNISHASNFTVSAGGNITLDSAGDIILDADGDDWKFHEGGTAVFEIKHESHGVDFLLNTGNEDWSFRGSDDGTTITALQLDISDAGFGKFNGALAVQGQSSAHLANSGTLSFDSNSSTTELSSYANDATSFGNIAFKTGYGGAAPTTMMQIQPGGVAIGTHNPQRELHVKSSGSGVAAFESTGAGLAIQGNSSTTALTEIVGYKQTGGTYHDINIRAVSSGAQLFLDTNGHVGIGTDSPTAGSSNTTTLEVAGATVVGFAAGSPFNTAGRKYTFESRYAGSNHLSIGYIADGSTHAQAFVASQNNLPLWVGVGTKNNIKMLSDRSTQLTGYVGFGTFSAGASDDVDTTVTKGARLRSMGGRGGQPNVLGWDHLDRSNSAFDHNSPITSSFVSSYNVSFSQLDGTGNNRWMLGDGPNGGLTWIWQGKNSNSSNSGGQAGWDCGSIGIDSNYTYMLVNYVKRMTSTATGTYYYGTQGIYDQNGNSLNNPYMTITATSNLPLGVWCADVHFIVSHQYTGNASLLNQGLWRMDTGARLQNWANQFSGVNLYRSYPSSTTTHGIGFRTYLYYAVPGDGTTLHWAQPAIYKCDGTEPTIAEIRGGDKTLAYSVTAA